MKTHVDKNIIINYLHNYIEQCKIIDDIKHIKNIRRPNFPELISEHLVFFYLLQFNTGVNWNTTGDLTDKFSNKIEVKCSSSTGPLSFGPTQTWNQLYLVDAINFRNNHYIIYKVNCNKTIFQKIKIINSETFLMKCSQKRRPRISLQNILIQLSDYVVKVYDGPFL